MASFIWPPQNGSGGSGTVTSVGLADGSTIPIFAITGSPVTTAGTLTETLIAQAKNIVLAGPASGANAQPTFRALTFADLPATPQKTITTTYTVDTGGLDYYLDTDTTSAAFTATLPAPTAGRTLVFSDTTGQWGTNNFTMAPHAGEKIAGLAANKVMQTPWGTVTLHSNGTDWFMS